MSPPRPPVRPSKGDRVEVYIPATDEYRTGSVEAVLSIQFTYTDDELGQLEFAFYSNEWRLI